MKVISKASNSTGGNPVVAALGYDGGESCRNTSIELFRPHSDKSIIKNPDLSYSNDELKLNVLVNYIKQIIE